jgi:hypothetical protein
MPNRLRLYDVRVSGFPEALGLCSSDIKSIAKAVNAAQRQLLYAKECGDEGWWGTFAEVRFQASRETPYVTMSREIARIEALDVCSRPVPLRNQFWEYLQYGNGRMPKMNPWRGWSRFTQGLTRNNAVTMVDPYPSPNPFNIKIFVTNAADVDTPLRVLLQGNDSTGSPIYTMDGPNNTTGQYVPLALPYAVAPQEMTTLTGIQKDVTAGAVQIFQSDPAGVLPDVLLLTMEPSETTASYRRYYLDHLPCWCCPQAPGPPCPPRPCQPVSVEAIVKLDLVPVTVDSDYCLIGNLEALMLQAQSDRMKKMDTTTATAKSAAYHKEAIRLLIGECRHYLGAETAAVRFSPFGNANLERLRISMK